MGRSSRPAGGYDKKTQAADIRAVVTALGYDRTLVVSHDIGIMVAYAYAARYPGKVERLVVMDAPLPGVGLWDEIVRHPALWHFSVRGPDAERLVRGRERIYLDRIWNAFTGDPRKMGPFVNPGWVKALAWTVAVIIAVLNAWLLVLIFF